MDAHPNTSSPTCQKMLLSHMQRTRRGPSFRDMMADMQRKMHEDFAAINDGLGSPMKSKFTIREASELTGLKRHTIRKRINQGEIEARLTVDGTLWFIPREEVRKLMPDRPNEDNRLEPDTEPNADSYYQ